jgi:LytS/YehU family sensor histidine kinase
VRKVKVPRSVIAILLVTLGAMVINLLYGRYDGWRDVAEMLLISMIYSTSIGWLCYQAGERFWRRGGAYSLPVNAAVMVGAVLLGSFLGHSIVVGVGLLQTKSFWGSYWVTLKFAALITVTFGLTVMIYEYYRKKYAWSELERERALKLASEARLASLASRIHPHFLFNTLNTISALIHEDPKQADEQLQRLSKLLRFSLDAPETNLVPLDRELQMVADYLEIERTRFAERLRYSVEASAEARECSVPPFSVQTLVENSVKHHIAKRREGGEVLVRAERRGATLVVTVTDDGPGIPAGAALPGHGLDILRGRLDALFPKDAKLEMAGSEVTITLPAHVDSRVRIG